MSRWFVAKIAALVVALAAPARAGEGDMLPLNRFPPEDAARAYLRANPTGQYAKLAFLALVEYRLMRENPGMTAREAMAVFSKGLRTGGAAPVYPAANTMY
jgi:hypothetical protein